MDNFRKPRNTGGSIDGFITRRKPAAPKAGNLRAFDQYYRPARPGYGPSGKPFTEEFKQAKTGSVPGEVRRVDTFGRGMKDGFKEVTATKIGFSDVKQAPGSELTRAFSAPALESPGLRRPGLQAGAAGAGKKRRLFKLKKRKAGQSKKRTKTNMKLRISAIAGVCILLLGGGLALRAYLISRGIFKGGGSSAILNNQNVDPSLLKGEGDGRVNVLILGKGGEEQRDGPELTDTLIVASIDPIAKEAALLSIPRDLWVKSPSGYQSKINEVYVNAKSAALNDYPFQQRTSNEATQKAEKTGIDAIKSTLTTSLGVPIHYYAMIDFTGFRKAIDTVGGIDIDVKEPLIDGTMAWLNGGRATIAGKGWQSFDGHRALMYARSRMGTNGTDFGRAERQREVILALKEKVLSLGTLANPIKLNQLLGDFGHHVTTDFSINEILRLYDLAKEIPGDKVASAGLDDLVKGDSTTVSGRALSIQVPKAGWNDFSEIQNYTRNIMRDAFLKQEDAKIAVLNGTETAGLATRKSTELKSFGYNIVSVGDAPTKTYTSTVLVDLRGGKNKYTLNYLEKRLGVKAVGSLPDSSINTSDADFVIILGSNETSSSQD